MAIVSQSGAGGSGGSTLQVDSDQLTDYGNYLIASKEALNTLLDSLNTQMSKITSGWSDNDGLAFQGKFATFIAEAQQISDDIEALGKFAVSEASKYDTILAESVTMMGE